MSLRPKTLSEVIGQDDVKKRLKISIEACKITGDLFPHSMFSGNFGLGKTTLAEALANELGQKIEIINGSNLRNVRALLPPLARVQEGSILFCDEIHKCSPLVQTFLLTVLEKYQYTLGSQQDSVTLDMPQFTFLGATTNIGPILEPLLNRFTYNYALQNYSIADLTEIILANSAKMGLDIAGESAIMIAGACRGTARTSINRLKWIADYSIANKINTVMPADIEKAFKIAGIGLDGSEKDDRRYMQKLSQLKVASLNTLASALRMDAETIEKNIEPFLIEKGLIKKTTKGRTLA